MNEDTTERERLETLQAQLNSAQETIESLEKHISQQKVNHQYIKHLRGACALLSLFANNPKQINRWKFCSIELIDTEVIILGFNKEAG